MEAAGLEIGNKLPPKFLLMLLSIETLEESFKFSVTIKGLLSSSVMLYSFGEFLWKYGKFVKRQLSVVPETGIQ